MKKFLLFQKAIEKAGAVDYNRTDNKLRRYGMNIAILLRYTNRGDGGHWDHIYHMQHDYEVMARKYGVGLVAIITEFDAERIVDICDGLILPGSPNMINPKHYGQEPTEREQKILDSCIVDEYAYDSKIIDMFVKRGKPIFGICGGFLALNVVFGGTRKFVNENYAHGLPSATERRMHEITVKPGSFVHDVFGKERVLVNSHHGGGIGRLAEFFEPVAVCDDGVIEAIENREKRVFATLWHPEQSFHDGDEIEHKFFENFLNICEKTKNERKKL